jgi:AcrR family transcriptional regulator
VGPVTSETSRPRLNRDRVLRAAVDLADRAGVDGLTIRSLATALEAKPMAIYHHVANKDEILDGIVDLVYAEIELPRATGEWREEMQRRSESMRSVLVKHGWALALFNSRRSPGQATISHLNAVLGLFRASGFSYSQTSLAVAFIDAYVLGFALQEVTLPFEGTHEVHALAEEVLAGMDSERFPHFVDFAQQHVLRADYDFAALFDHGLQLVLDGVQRLGPSSPVSS